MSLLALILVLAVIGVAMMLIHQYVPSPFSIILLVVCGVVLLFVVLQVAGVNLGGVRVGA